MKRYVDWVAAEALPVWAERGFDRAHGRFHERLDGESRPLDVPLRAMVQARQIAVFAHAAELGWFPDGGALAEAALATLVRDWGEEAEGQASFAFSVGQDGRMTDATRDAYAHAFILFALAAVHRLTGDPAPLARAERVQRFIAARLLDPAHGGVRDAWPEASPHKRQNPQMHLLEAYLALEEAAPGRGWAGHAEAVVDLLEGRMFDAEAGVLREHFAADWSPHPEAARADLCEPGHHHEWVWLLDRHARLTGRATAAIGSRLADTALRHGHAPGGLIVDEHAADGRVLKSSHRIWPHTEAIKGALVAHERGDAAALGRAGRLADLLTRHFLDRPFAGGWIDHIDDRGRPLVGHVPASSLYHLFVAAAEAARIAGDRRAARADAVAA